MKNLKRPKLVWVVFLYHLLSFVTGGGSLVWLSHVASGSPQASAAIGAISPVGWVLIVLIMALELGGAIALFALRRSAYPLFVTALCVSAVQTLMQSNGIFSTGDSHGHLTIAIVWVIDISVCLYARSLRSRGVLT